MPIIHTGGDYSIEIESRYVFSYDLEITVEEMEASECSEISEVVYCKRREKGYN